MSEYILFKMLKSSSSYGRFSFRPCPFLVGREVAQMRLGFVERKVTSRSLEALA